MERLLELQSIINWLLRERRSMNHRIDRQTHVIVSNAIHNSNLASTNRNLAHQNAYLRWRLNLLNAPADFPLPPPPIPPQFLHEPPAMFNPLIPPPPQPPFFFQNLPAHINYEAQLAEQQQEPPADVNNINLSAVALEGGALNTNGVLVLYQQCVACFAPPVWKLLKCPHAFICANCFVFDAPVAVAYSHRDQQIINGFFEGREQLQENRRQNLENMQRKEGQCQQGFSCRCSQCQIRLQLRAKDKEIICPYCAIASPILIRVPPPEEEQNSQQPSADLNNGGPGGGADAGGNGNGEGGNGNGEGGNGQDAVNLQGSHGEERNGSNEQLNADGQGNAGGSSGHTRPAEEGEFGGVEIIILGMQPSNYHSKRRRIN